MYHMKAERENLKKASEMKNYLLYYFGTANCKLRAYNLIVKREGFRPKSIVALSCQYMKYSVMSIACDTI